jgi:hypothetical protein
MLMKRFPVCRESIKIESWQICHDLVESSGFGLKSRTFKVA